MPLQNRVTPEGEIVAIPARGLMMGNRGGALHGADRTLGHRRWVSRQWICCVLSFNGRQRTVMAPNRYTELFFLDEATAFAAGHRPCFECRRQAFMSFATLWAGAQGAAGRATASDMDAVLHRERVDRAGRKVVWQAALAALPPGAMVRWDGKPALVLKDRLLAWTPDGYGTMTERPPDGPVEVLTPRGTVAVLSSGYEPMLHPSASMA